MGRTECELFNAEDECRKTSPAGTSPRCGQAECQAFRRMSSGIDDSLEWPSRRRRFEGKSTGKAIQLATIDPAISPPGRRYRKRPGMLPLME